MKLQALAILTGTFLAIAPAYADDARPAPKGPPKTMGDEGTLPSTSTVGGHVPNMGTADPATTTTTGPVTQKGPPKRMGDQGTLPATNKMGGAVPQMNEDK